MSGPVRGFAYAERSGASDEAAVEEGRVQMMRRYLSEAAGLSGVEVRTHSTILYNSLYRFDGKLLVNGHAFGALAGESPVLHLRRLPTGEMWQHCMKSFERVWERATSEPS